MLANFTNLSISILLFRNNNNITMFFYANWLARRSCYSTIKFETKLSKRISRCLKMTNTVISI